MRLDRVKIFERVLQALSIPYCQSTWMSVAGYVYIGLQATCTCLCPRLWLWG